MGAITLLAAAVAWFVDAQPWVTPTLPMVESLLRDKQYAAAAKLAGRLVKHDQKNARAWFALARARTGAGDKKGAVDALRQIPEWSLLKDDALLFEAKLLLEMRRGQDAERAFLRCIERGGTEKPSTVSARLELFALYAMEERVDEFITLFWDTYPLLSPEDRLPALTMRMRIEFEQTKPELNVALLSDYVKNDPTDVNARAGLAAALDHASEHTRARRLYEEALRDAPDNLSIRERLCELVLRLGDQDTFLKTIDARPSANNDRDGLQKLIGQAALMRDDLPRAIAAFTKAAELGPDLPEHQHRLAQACLRARETDRAAAASAERTRLAAAREALRKAWNAFADAYETNPQAVSADSVKAVADACRALNLPREADAWEAEATRLAHQSPK